MKQIYRILLGIISFLYISSLYAEGFCAGTLVCTKQGLMPIECITNNDHLINNNRIISIFQKHVSQYVKIHVHNCCIDTSLDQLFFTKSRGWCTAHELLTTDELVCADGTYLFIDCIEVLNQECTLHTLSVEPDHIFCITPYYIIVHNMEPITVATSAAAVVTLSICPPAGIGLIAGKLLCAAVAGIGGYLLYKREKKKKPKEQFIRADGGHFNNNNNNKDPKKNDDDDEEHPHGIYKDSPYHHVNSKGRKSPCPKNGQRCLDYSLPSTTEQRIAIEENYFVILKKTMEREFHGYIVKWGDVPIHLQNSLKRYGAVDASGEILKQITEKVLV